MNCLTSKAIDFVRFPLAVMVVIDHSYGSPIIPTDYYISLFGMEDVLYYICTTVPVPAFFIVSGYLFFQKFEKWDWIRWGDKILSRLHTLIIPYFIWCLLFVIYMPIQGVFILLIKGYPINECIKLLDPQNVNWLHALWDSHVWGGQILNWLGVNIVHSTGPELAPFWFIRDLIVVTLLSPIIFFCIRRTNLGYIILIGLLYFSGIWLDIHGIHSVTLFFYSLGAYFAIRNKDLCLMLYKNRWFLGITYVLLLPFVLVLDETGFYGLRKLHLCVGSLTILCLSYFLVSKGMKMCKFLISSCFFCYAFHYFILTDYNKLLCKIADIASPLWLIVIYELKPLFVVILCLAIYCFLSHYFPRVCKVLCGSR